MAIWAGGARLLAALACLVAVAGCTIPRTGPSKGALNERAVERRGDAFVVRVDDAVVRAADYQLQLGFSQDFLTTRPLPPDAILPGDTVSLTIWENVEDGLLGPSAAGPTPLEQVQVSDEGFIFVPYAGRLLAAGKTPEQLRRLITERLADQTPDPQVVVNRAAGNGATVSVAGTVGQQGVYPLDRPTRTLSSMLAQAGGVTIAPEIAQVTVLRGGNSDTVWFNSLYSQPINDIALRGGDRILVEADERSYTALGAIGSQRRVPFESQELSAVEALAQAGGLVGSAADPTGIFVLRLEEEEVARRVLAEPVFGPQQIVYLFDLTRGDGLFNARNFQIRDGDTVYVTEAPVTQFNKAVSAFFGSLTTVASIQTVAPTN